jgi:hypothetical protein
MKTFTVMGSQPGDGGVYRAENKTDALLAHFKASEGISDETWAKEEKEVREEILKICPDLETNGIAGDYEVKEVL